jgi:hypothetical protein
LAGAKPAKWLAKPTKWLASQFAGRGRVIPPKLTPPPGTSHLARAQAILASQKRRSPVRQQKATHFCIHVNGGPSDNPMQSEVTGHIGGKGNYFCRKCKVGGTQKEKASDEVYHALFEVPVRVFFIMQGLIN